MCSKCAEADVELDSEGDASSNGRVMLTNLLGRARATIDLIFRGIRN